MHRFQAYIDAGRDRFLDELKTWCSQPSVAAQGTGLEEMAALVERRLRALGARVQRFDVAGGAPIVYAVLGKGERSMLIYNHYDVQPAEPLHEWESPPFEPSIRAGRIYARGVADDKGDLLCRLQAMETYLATLGPLPLQIRFVVEGEEEVGSPHLSAFADENPGLLEADGCLWETGGKDAARRFVLELGVKGLCYVELVANASAGDLHSMWGGVIPNAAWRLVWALGTLKDADERILVDGLAEKVRPPSQEEWTQLATIPFDEAQVKQDFGLAGFVRGLTGVDLLAKHFYEPTCTICGLNSGYTGEGLKTVLPALASAKVGFRLVPDLTPSLVVDLLRFHLDRRGFGDIEVRPLGGIMPARSSLGSPFVRACVASAEATYGVSPIIYPTSPGSGPLHTLCRGMPAVMAGVANANSRLHAPNENVIVDDYLEGIRFVGELIHRFAV
jgi:acetylornithine deacetylase/succinyl-diaminopimelate desuccinylase-like protein